MQPASVPAGNNDAELARGAYLVEGLEHCGTCHTDRGIGLQEKALTPQDGSAYLSGAVVDNFSASDLRGDPLTGLGSWERGGYRHLPADRP